MLNLKKMVCLFPNAASQQISQTFPSNQITTLTSLHNLCCGLTTGPPHYEWSQIAPQIKSLASRTGAFGIYKTDLENKEGKAACQFRVLLKHISVQFAAVTATRIPAWLVGHSSRHWHGSSGTGQYVASWSWKVDTFTASSQPGLGVQRTSQTP